MNPDPVTYPRNFLTQSPPARCMPRRTYELPAGNWSTVHDGRHAWGENHAAPARDAFGRAQRKRARRQARNLHTLRAAQS